MMDVTVSMIPVTLFVTATFCMIGTQNVSIRSGTEINPGQPADDYCLINADRTFRQSEYTGK
jgi:hypothetical protein